MAFWTPLIVFITKSVPIKLYNVMVVLYHNFTHPQVHADDPDTGDGGSVQYSISSTTPLDVRSDFSINEDTGIITLAGTLDRETNTVITLRVVANDEGIPGRPCDRQ